MYEKTWGFEDENEVTSTNTHTKSTALKEVIEKGKRIEMKIHRTDGGNIEFYQTVLNCGGETLRYHKIIAEGSKDKNKFPQSTVVYEWYNNTDKPVQKPLFPNGASTQQSNGRIGNMVNDKDAEK